TLRELTIWAHCSVVPLAKADALAARHVLHCIPNRLVRTHPIYEMSSKYFEVSGIAAAVFSLYNKPES
ncbi:MAG: hypothetical protein WA071_13820, partial [Undibacterium umbellatum]|uniref:hypothetical protein n=1 Tax=Undibacterium umbellatum TaxID=2762300 RepID=UPI003BB65D3B